MNDYSRYLIFSIVFIFVYTLCFYYGVALFKYFPLIMEFHVDSQPDKSGPPISWYGWIAVATLVSLPVALIVPRAWGNRISPTLAWLAPALVIVAVLVYEKRWFIPQS